MTSHIKQVRTLLDEAYSLPTLTACLTLLEEAVRIADLHHDIELGIEVAGSRSCRWPVNCSAAIS